MRNVEKSKLNAVRIMIDQMTDTELCFFYEVIYGNDLNCKEETHEYKEYFDTLTEMVFEVTNNYPLSANMVKDFILKEIARRFYYDHEALGARND